MRPSVVASAFLLNLLVVVLALGESDVKLDPHGCRVLSELPATGVHPRVYFTAKEYPRMRERLAAPGFGEVFAAIRKRVVDQVRREWSEFAETDQSNPSDEMILRYVVAGEMRNQHWGIASVTAVLEDDTGLRTLMAKVITNYARLLLASRERALEQATGGAISPEWKRLIEFWTHPRFDVGVSWTLGAAGYAVSYDVLYGTLTETQRSIVRRAIAVGTTGRRSYGNGMARGYAVSNHYGYHGDLVGLLAAIEGEEGYDPAAFDGIAQVLRDYWEIGFTEAGACHEDGYGPDLGLRAGSRGLLVLARRGYNVFETDKFRRFLGYVAQEWEPFPGGAFMGGASGGPYYRLYPTSFIIARYMYPETATANYNYRHVVGDAYERDFRWQGWLDTLLYGSSWQGERTRRDMLERARLPLSVYYPVRGKLVVRSNWSTKALYATLDARPDAHAIGHDKVDRGNFTLSALGRMWASAGTFHTHNESTENSLVHIDGMAQAWKAPSVRFLWYQDSGAIVGGAADLKYAYDWAWSPPWASMNDRFPPPWEPEFNGPLDLGWPSEHRTPEIPDALNGSETGYAHTNNLHRQPYNPVEEAQRSLHLVRGPYPYVLLCDDIRKDDRVRRYEWYMQLAPDLIATSTSAHEVLLAEPGGDRRLLIRFLQEEPGSPRLESYNAVTPKKAAPENAQRLVYTVTTVEPRFRTFLFPLPAGTPPPVTTWSRNRSQLTIRFGHRTDVLIFERGLSTGTTVTLRREP